MSSRVTFFEVEILDYKTKKQLCFLDKVEPHASINDIRLMFHKFYPQWYPARQSMRLDPSNLACICHSSHYIKRLIEIIFVHRFSHGTMPLKSIFKNCFFYWGFAAWLAYYINHPLYTPPSYGQKQINFSLITFLLCEAGNFSIHVELNNLRGNGPKTRRIPYPTKNPFTWLFFFVSCPNYTYEVGAWISFTIMTQCVPVGLFTLVGFVQMTIWAKDKHCTYVREFKDYPSLRMPIIPFLL
ncbi:very-long-chain enoyl-CoA reductase-like [Vombatus ursinus]|uniref:very-long-chain enoyl-CoA reductase-like n=1 Tax=Vombatus ursinus TaxID=29139 RepID=UPI000FFCE14C|nr:very-long-chain enoyl-CoA reductase-like [Vombatus ursinus]